MSFALPILGKAAIGFGGSLLAKKLSGGGGKVGEQTPAQRRAANRARNKLQLPSFRNITTPGADITVGAKRLSVRRRPEVARTLRQGKQASQREARGIGGVLSRLSPRFAETISASQGLVQAGRDTFGRSLERLLQDRGTSVNTLRQNLSRRGILGSSFGEQAISERLGKFADLERDLTTEEAQFAAEQAQQLQQNLSQNLFQETALRTQLIEQRSNIIQESINREIEQTNFETQIARDLAIATQQSLTAGNAAILGVSVQQGQLAIQQAELDAERERGIGAFAEPFLNQISEGIFGGTTGGGGSRNAILNDPVRIKPAFG